MRSLQSGICLFHLCDGFVHSELRQAFSSLLICHLLKFKKIVVDLARQIIKAERCITYLNEKDSKIPFPDWLEPSWHNAITGCMRCQIACPYNKDFRDRYENRDEFTKEETEYLLRGEFSGEKAARMERRLMRSGLDLTIFPRNLAVLMR